MLIPRFVLAIGLIFNGMLAFLYLRHHVKMWTVLLKPAFGGVAVSEAIDKRIAYVCGGFAVVFFLILLIFLILSFVMR